MLRQLTNRKLTWVTKVHRPRYIRITIHETYKAINEIVHIAEASSLLPLSINGNIFALQSLNNEITHHPPIVRIHSRAIGIKDTRHLNRNIILPMIIKEQSFSAALTLIITGANSDRIDLAPV